MKMKLPLNTCLIWIVIAGCLVASCEKKLDPRTLQTDAIRNILQTTVLSSPDSPTVYNYVWLNADQTVDRFDSAYHIELNAAFTDSTTNQLIAINSLSVNSQNITSASTGIYYLGYSDSSGTLGQGTALYGTNVSIKIEGTSANDVLTESIYMPKKISSNTTGFPLGNFNNTGSLTVNWTPDPLNTWGNVAIKVWYDAAMSQFLNDPTLPTTNSELSYVVPDNGSYTISESDLQTFHQHSYVTLSLGRGSEVTGVLPISKMTVFYFTTSSETSPPLYLGCLSNWQNTTAPVQCQTSGGINTGYQQQQQEDLSTCSPTYGQFRWNVIGQNLSACPITAVVDGSNTMTTDYYVEFTNTVTKNNPTFPIAAQTNSLVQIGTVPPGTYNVQFYAGGQPQNATFYLNGSTQSGTGATFNNITINSTVTVKVY